MRKLHAILAAVLLMSTATLAQAQQPQGQGQRGGGRGNMMMLMEGITLSAEQQAKMDSVTKKYADERQAMMNDQSGDRDAMRTKMGEMMTKQQDEMKALLTDEQKKIFEKNVAGMAARRPAGGGRPPLS